MFNTEIDNILDLRAKYLTTQKEIEVIVSTTDNLDKYRMGFAEGLRYAINDNKSYTYDKNELKQAFNHLLWSDEKWLRTEGTLEEVDFIVNVKREAKMIKELLQYFDNYFDTFGSSIQYLYDNMFNLDYLHEERYEYIDLQEELEKLHEKWVEDTKADYYG